MSGCLFRFDVCSHLIFCLAPATKKRAPYNRGCKRAFSEAYSDSDDGDQSGKAICSLHMSILTEYLRLDQRNFDIRSLPSESEESYIEDVEDERRSSTIESSEDESDYSGILYTGRRMLQKKH